MISTQDMRKLEMESNVPPVKLMENAGTAFVSELLTHVEVKNKKVLVCCYHGKNGGDGFVIADLLTTHTEVDLLFLGDEEKMVPETEHFFHHINHNGLIQFVTLDTVDLDEYDVIIDAILGIGIHHYLKPEIAATIKSMNESKAFKVSVDVPTGLNPDTGEVIKECVAADLIITFHDTKPGLAKFGEKVKIVGIGL